MKSFDIIHVEVKSIIAAKVMLNFLKIQIWKIEIEFVLREKK